MAKRITSRATFAASLAFLATSCSDGSHRGARFFGVSNTYEALDAAAGSGALLRNLPGNPSNQKQLNIEVYGRSVTRYIFALVGGSEPCETASYSESRGIDTRITEEVSGDGMKRLCVKGAGEQLGYQTKPTEFVWEFDGTPPDTFDFVGLQSLVRNPPSSVTWSPSDGANTYRFQVSANASCDPNAGTSIPAANLQTPLGSLPDGIHYLCLSAIDLAGNSTPATSSPFALKVDQTAPGRFHISSPLTITNVQNPTISWTRPADASAINYRMVLAYDSSCQTPIESIGTQQQPHTSTNYTVTQSLADGRYYVCLKASDAVGNTVAAENSPYRFDVDTVSPLISFQNLPPSKVTTLAIGVTSASSDFSAFRYKIIDGRRNCEDVGSYGQEVPAITVIRDSIAGVPDGLLKICVISRDVVGNWTAADKAQSYTWLKDTIAPTLSAVVPELCGPIICPKGGKLSISQINASDLGSGLSNLYLKLTAPDGQCFKQNLTGFEACTANSFIAVPGTPSTFDIPYDVFHNKNLRGVYEFSLKAVDQAGNENTISKRMTWDNVAPEILAFSIVGSQQIAGNPNKGVTKPFTKAKVKAKESESKIADICFISATSPTLVPNNSGIPSTNDRCWVSIPPLAAGIGDPLKEVELSYLVGFIGPENYAGAVWVRDQAKNVSLSSLLTSDFIRFNPGVVPELTDVIASSNDQQSSPLSTDDRTIKSIGSRVKIYIKWIAKDSDKALPSDAISIYYTHNEVDWVPIVEKISANSLTSCTPQQIVPKPADPAKEKTGCYTWSTNPSPALEGYTKIRVAVRDSDDQVTFSTAPILNLPKVNFFAGNTETGIGASARSTIFQNQISFPGDQDTGSILVTSRGEIIFRDYRRGIFKVSADTGILQLLIKNDSNSLRVDAKTCLDDPSAALKSPIAIALDYDDTIIVLESNRLRRIDLNDCNGTGSITSIAGHGGSAGGSAANNDEVVGVTADNIKINVINDRSSRVVYALPNNKIVFVSNPSGSGKAADQTVARQRLRVLDTKTKQITTIQFQGTFQFPKTPNDTPTDSDREVTDCRVWNMAVGFNKSNGDFNSAVLNVMGNQLSVGNPQKYWPECAVKDLFYKAKFMAVNPSTMTVDDQTNLNNNAYLWGASVVGMDGNIYHVDRSYGEILKFDPGQKQFNKIVGSTGIRAPGTCPDQTPALGCAIDPQDVFVNPAGYVFFMDRGRLRTIQGVGALAKVVTVMGQSYGYGDGQNALSARFGILNTFDRWEDRSNPIKPTKKIVVLDALEQKFREVTVGGDINLVAGDGTSKDIDTSKTAPDAKDQSIMIDSGGRNIDSFALRPDGTIIFRTSTQLVQLDRKASAKWIPFAGKNAGNDTWRTLTTGVGMNFNLNANKFFPHILGIDTSNSSYGSVLISHTYHDYGKSAGETSQDTYLMTFDLDQSGTNSTMRRIAGKMGTSAQYPSNFDAKNCLSASTKSTDCFLVSGYSTDYMSATPYPVGKSTSWIFAHRGTTTLIKVEPVPSGHTLKAYQTLDKMPVAFAVKRGTVEADDTVFYCNTSGALKKRYGGVEIDLPLGLSTGEGRLLCSGRKMQFDDVTNRLTFIYSQNGLNGIAEYIVP